MRLLEPKNSLNRSNTYFVGPASNKMSGSYNKNGGSFTFTPQDCTTVALRSITDNIEQA